MSTFNVRARRIRAIEPHENADRLEMAVIDDYRAVVGKGAHKPGDLVVYIPKPRCAPNSFCAPASSGTKRSARAVAAARPATASSR